MKYPFLIHTTVITLLFSSCSPGRMSTRFELLDPDKTGVHFSNQLTLTDSFNIMEFDYIYNGGGVAVADFNGDELPDLFFTGNQVSCRLYLNKGNLQFEDVTEAANLTTSQWAEGVTIADINNDELPDIYVSTSSGGTGRPNQNLLFINLGLNDEGTPLFTEQATEYGIADTSYNTQSAFFDYDLDGDLDLYVLSNALETFNRNTTRPKKLDGTGKSTDKLYRNNGDGTFTNVSRAAGILTEGYGLGIVITDINKDSWPDVYLANDFVTNDILYINNGDGTFTNRIADQIRHQSHNGMGADAADYNNDGLMDIVVVDMMPETNLRQKAMMVPFASYDRFTLNLQMGYEPQYVRNTLQLNNGNGSFSEIGQLAGIYQTDWSWAPLAADLDNDGYRDLYITNGYGKDITDMDYVSYSQSLRSFGTPEAKRKALLEEIGNLVEIRIPNYMYKNNGDLTFTDKTTDWGLTQPSLSNGSVYADLDNDGDLDLVANNINEPAFIYKNNTISGDAPDSTAGYLKVRLNGPDHNRQGLGARITVYYQKENKTILQYHEQYLSRGYKSSVDPTIHFGLGAVSVIDSLEVIWPGGQRQVLSEVSINKLVKLDYQDASPASATTQKVKPLFTEVSASLGLDYIHEAEDFADFKIQPLLPHKHSENGPGIATGDINGDGLEDFFTGGSPGHPGRVFIQKRDGTFASRTLPGEQLADDMGALLFDADNDGDLDLYVVSGGSRFPSGSREYCDRFYRNDGTGQLEQDTAAIPSFTTSGSVVTAADFDRDGDLDLFVGGRVTPHEYPLPAKSHILENKGGLFEDITSKICPAFERLGMVTAALWTDFDQDQRLDLLVTGEWMPIAAYRQTKGEDGTIRFVNMTEDAGLAQSAGWWNSLQGADLDQDGDIDYVAGNLGLNSRYHASADKPVSIYAKDFDKNGEIDPIMFYYNQGKNYPAHSRGLLINQIAAMRGRFPTYETLGQTTFDEFFAEGELDGAYVLNAWELQTSCIENLGNGKFSVRNLPVEAQFSPVCGIAVRDFNGDGYADLLLTGNSWGTELTTGRYDASYGSYLLGDGQGHFAPVPARESGLSVQGNSKALAELAGPGGKPLYLVSQNRDQLLALARTGNEGATQTIKVGPQAQSALVTLKNGKEYYHEFYYGSAYLSQSSRVLQVSKDAVSVIIVDYTGETHTEELRARQLTMR